MACFEVIHDETGLSQYGFAFCYYRFNVGARLCDSFSSLLSVRENSGASARSSWLR